MTTLINISIDGKCAHGTTSLYQLNRENGKQLPRNFIYLIHEKTPMILIENRDELDYDTNDEGIHINRVLSKVYYKQATINFTRTNNIFNERFNITSVEPPLFAKYNGKEYMIEPGMKFHISSKGIVSEKFNEAGKEIYFDTFHRTSEFYDYILAHPESNSKFDFENNSVKYPKMMELFKEYIKSREAKQSETKQL